MSKTNTIAPCYILKFSKRIENDCDFCKNSIGKYKSFLRNPLDHYVAFVARTISFLPGGPARVSTIKRKDFKSRFNWPLAQ